MSETYRMLENDDPIVKEILGNVKQVQNGDAAIPVGSRQMTPQITELNAELEAQIKEAEEGKTLSITLSARNYALMLREAVKLKMPVEQHLEDVVAEMCLKRLGKATISGASFMGQKVVAPTNSYGREF